MITFGFIFARGGSKGLPGKNIRPIAGKPLICYAIEAAKACPLIQRIFVSTDDETTAGIAVEAGAEVPFIRPAELATDDSPEWLSWRHAIDFFEKAGQPFDIFTSIPVTAPMRRPEDIEKCIRLLEKSPETDAVITVTRARRHPAFNMVTLDDTMGARLATPPEHHIYRRQDAPELYDITTVAYASRPEFIRTAEGIFEGRVNAVVVPEERALDVDTAFDFKIAELLMSNSAPSE